MASTSSDSPHSHGSSDAHEETGAHGGARQRYERTKRDFDDMSLEQQASFLIEASASALARGLEHAGRTLADELESLFRKGRRRGRTGGHRSSPGPAEPETSQSNAPRE